MLLCTFIIESELSHGKTYILFTKCTNCIPINCVQKLKKSNHMPKWKVTARTQLKIRMNRGEVTFVMRFIWHFPFFFVLSLNILNIQSKKKFSGFSLERTSFYPKPLQKPCSSSLLLDSIKLLNKTRLSIFIVNLLSLSLSFLSLRLSFTLVHLLSRRPFVCRFVFAIVYRHEIQQ